MTSLQKFSLFFLRISIGWLFLYAGVTKIIAEPAWSAAGYLKGAKTFTGFYQWLAGSSLLPLTNFLNEWGLTLLGIALILGIFVRLSSVLGALLMLLYYFPALDFPVVDHGYIVDQHVIYIFALLLLGSLRAGRVFGLENWCANLPICARFPRLRAWLG